MPPLLEASEHLVAKIEVALFLGARGGAERTEQQVFFDRQSGEQPPPFRHQRDA